LKPGTFLSAPEAAARLGLTRQRVQQLIKSGRLRADRIGNRWAVKPRDVEKLKDERAATSEATGAGEAERMAHDSRPGPLPLKEEG
jgi:excisionase family DNA binding protein